MDEQKVDIFSFLNQLHTLTTLHNALQYFVLEKQSQFYTYSYKRKSSCIHGIVLHTLQSAAYFAQPVHSSKRSRSRVRPLNNIRSCCLPRPREGLLPLPSIHISANTHASLREIQMHHLRTGCNVMQCTHMRHASASGECRLRCWKT